MPTIKQARLGSAPEEYYRVLVDRLWPRGVRREEAPFDEWIKDAAPSHELRKWYGHEPARYGEFAERYREELAARRQEPPVLRLLELMQAKPVVLLTATRDVERSQVPVLAKFLADEAGPEWESPGSL